jgi:hypothetical protein
MLGENGAPTYRNRYVRREPGFKAPDPATSGVVRAIILSQGPLYQLGVFQEQSGYTSEQLTFSAIWTDVRIAPSARIGCWDMSGRLVWTGADNRTPELTRSACHISGEVVYLPSTLSALSALNALSAPDV